MQALGPIGLGKLGGAKGGAATAKALTSSRLHVAHPLVEERFSTSAESVAANGFPVLYPLRLVPVAETDLAKMSLKEGGIT